ncbi:MAG: SRPBCC domain-containing protein, partial [candidate division Zixibacteria bacterium]|nr:SRPBCC domain-containing protein [candidate division Zixibacteria bacterium]
MRVHTDPNSLYDALTNPIKLAIWFCNHAEINLKVRGAVRMSGENCAAVSFPEGEIKGEILQLEPNRLFTYRWPISGMESEVTFEIYDKDRYCNLVIGHAKILEKSLMMDAWITYYYNLRAFLKTGRPAYRFDYTHIDKETIKRELF